MSYVEFKALICVIGLVLTFIWAYKADKNDKKYGNHYYRR